MRSRWAVAVLLAGLASTWLAGCGQMSLQDVKDQAAGTMANLKSYQVSAVICQDGAKHTVEEWYMTGGYSRTIVVGSEGSGTPSMVYLERPEGAFAYYPPDYSWHDVSGHPGVPLMPTLLQKAAQAVKMDRSNPNRTVLTTEAGETLVLDRRGMPLEFVDASGSVTISLSDIHLNIQLAPALFDKENAMSPPR